MNNWMPVIMSYQCGKCGAENAQPTAANTTSEVWVYCSRCGAISLGVGEDANGQKVRT